MEANMGRAKEAMQLAEDNWARMGHKCAVCAQTVPLSEKDSFFETGMCGYCRHGAEKDD